MPISLESNCKSYVKQHNYLKLKSCHTDSLRDKLLALYVKNTKFLEVDLFLPQKMNKGKIKYIKYEKKVIKKRKEIKEMKVE